MGTVRLSHVTKRYEDVVAVDDVNLEVQDGEFVTFVGPSGCGKSTTLEMVAGLTTPSDGEVWIAEREVTNLPPKDRGIAMVFQNIALFPHMDVYDNISFGLRLRKYPREEIDSRVDRAAEILQIEGLLDRMPDELSGGQRQRVAIGRAIVREPEVFLMDEPLANLDAKLRVHMRTELQRLHKQLETTIVYVTHDQAEAMTMSDRIAVLNEGRLQQIAPPLTCYTEPANRFVAGFIGSPSMNFLEGELTASTVRTEHFELDVDVDRVEGQSAGDAVTIGVRPENVYPAEGRDELSHPSRPIEVTTDVLEPMGDEIFVYLLFDDAGERTARDATESDQLLMSVDPDADVAEDRRIEVVLDRSKVHLFDTASGEALVHGLTTFERDRPLANGAEGANASGTDDDVQTSTGDGARPSGAESDS